MLMSATMQIRPIRKDKIFGCVATIRRAELTEDETSMTAANDLAVRRASEAAGVEFIDENGGGPGVRLRKPVRGKSGK
jgi:hypothetical protein